jgi:hypothetical protein
MGRHSQLKRKLRKLLPAVTVTLTTVPFAAWSPTAEAFFPPVWPVSPPVTVVPPAVPPVVVPPTVPPPPFVPPPPVVPPVIVPPPVVPPIIVSPPPPPSGTPEPATLVSSVIGLAAAAGYGLRKRKKNGEAKGE